MKHFIYIFACITFSACHGADGEYTPLERISIEEHSNEEQQKITIKTAHDNGIHTTKGTLNLSKQKLTSVSDLEEYRQRLQLNTLTVLNAAQNSLNSDDLDIIIRSIATLKTLIFSHNHVTEVAKIPVHQNLATLLLDHNRISKFSVAPFFEKFPNLKRFAVNNNYLESDDITNFSGFYTSVEEAWFGHDALTPSTAAQLITIFPNLTCELYAGSDAVQRHYSETTQQWDNCSEWKDDCVCCQWRQRDCCPAAYAYVLAPIIGAVVGAVIGGIAYGCTMQKIPDDWLSGGTCGKYGWPEIKAECENIQIQNQHLVQKYMAILVPLGTVLPPLCYRAGKTIYNYLKTKPENRYKTIFVRTITPQPTLFELLEDKDDGTNTTATARAKTDLVFVQTPRKPQSQSSEPQNLIQDDSDDATQAQEQ